MGGGRSRGELDGDVEEVSQGEACRGYGQRSSIDPFHGDEEGRALLLQRIEVNDVRVIEAGGGARLALEPIAGMRLLRELWRQDLEGHLAAQSNVLGEI